MEWSDFKNAEINAVEKQAAEFLRNPQNIGRAFWDALDRFNDNDGIIKLAALILLDAPKGDIRAALEDVMFSQKFIEDECERIEEVCYGMR